MHFFSFPHWEKAYSGRFRQVLLSFGGQGGQVVVLYKNNSMGIGVGGFNIGRLRRVAFV